MKKKLLIGIPVALLLLVVIVVAVVFVKLDSIVKAGVERVGPQLTKSEVRLEGVTISVFSGKGGITGLFVGNPEGYQTESAIKVGLAELDLDPGSVTAEKIIIESIVLEGPEITLEGGLRDNNLTAIQRNIAEFAGEAEQAPGEPENAGANRKLQVDLFRITDAKVHLHMPLLGAQTRTVSIPAIEIENLGAGPDGITAAELSKVAFDRLMAAILPVVVNTLSDMGGKAGEAAEELRRQLDDRLGEAASGLGEEAGKAVNEGLNNLFRSRDE